ncbi:MAG TPA: ATP-binding protein, partial [Limnochordales bacterium]
MSFLAFARALGGVVLGIDGHLVEVEVHVGPGLPEFRLVGLPGAAVRESRDRVRAALRQLGVSLPAGRITVNLAPARLPKPGSGLDLPIACAVMAAAGRLPTRALEGWLLVGELSLDGSVRASDGTVSVLVAARQAGLRRAVVPLESWPAARLVDGLALQPVATLAQAVEGLARGRFPPVPPDQEPQQRWPAGQTAGLDLAEVRGHALARRALEVAAAGGHPLMLVGPPGSGKTMLAQRLPTLLPPLDRQRWLEVVQVYTAAGRLVGGPGAPGVPPAGWRPFRSPHHSLTRASLVGGGSRLAPGELTLAHRGVLFLDEFAELSQEVVDALREPMEEGWVT